MKVQIIGVLATVAMAAFSQVSPHRPPGIAAESSEPFCWYLVPSDEIGFKDSPVAFQVTYDGAINTGFGELDFKTGGVAVNKRVKTPFEGYLPIVDYAVDQSGVRYAFRTFAAPYKQDPREELVGFVRVTISNPGKSRAHATLGATFRPRGGTERSDMPCRPWYRAKFMDQRQFDAKNGSAEIGDGTAVKNGHVVFLYSNSPAPAASTNGPAVDYSLDLAPGESRQIDFKIPFVPIQSSKTSTVRAVRGMDYGQTFLNTVLFWHKLLAGATRIELPDPKVVDTVRSSLIYDLMARDIEADGKHFTQTVNKFQYHGFFARDTSFIARSYELLNLPGVARGTVEKYLVRDRSGHVTKFFHEMPDDWGQSLWALGAYYTSTGDKAFAADVAPAIPAHLDDFVAETSKDPLGLWPVAGPYDNELINGHYTSHNLWALLGLRNAEILAKAAGDMATAQRAHDLYGKFFQVFYRRLATLTAKDDGYIPPGMDDPIAGYDWENASGGVYPFGVFSPQDPWVTATVKMEREYKYREGIMTWGPNAWAGKVAAMQGQPFDPLYLHDYDTFQVDETLVAREDQRAVVEDLYSTLVHTSATNGGFETSIRPWGDRNPDGNYPPHGWFAARYNELVRNMLLREVGDTLHLASVLAPKWVMPGKTMSVKNGATEFGNVDFGISSRAGGADVTIHANWRHAPRSLVFHIPWFLNVTSANADGRAVRVVGGAITLPPSTRSLRLRWTWREHPDLSYERAVRIWLQKAYAPRPGEDMDHLFPTATRPGLSAASGLFLKSLDVRLVSRSGSGAIYYTLNGQAPSTHSTRYSRPIHLSQTTRLRAIEVWPNGQASDELNTLFTRTSGLAAVSAGVVEPGLAYRYFEGEFPAMPKFADLTPKQSGVASIGDLDSVQHRPEQFAVEYDGYVQAPSDGIYTFFTQSDDGSKLWIDGRLVVDNDGPHPVQERRGDIALRAGHHKIHIEFFDAGGANSLHTLWSGPGIAKSRIPGADLSH